MHKAPMLYFNFYYMDIRKWIPIMTMLEEHGYIVRWWSRKAHILDNNKPFTYEWDGWVLFTDEHSTPDEWYHEPVAIIQLEEREWGVE